MPSPALRGVAALICALVVAPGAARAGWSAPTTISPATTAVDDLQVVSGADGRALATWRFRLADLAGTHAISRRPDGVWGPVRTLGTYGLSSGRATGTGDGIFGLTAFGRSRILGLVVTPGAGRGASLDLWQGSAYGRLARVRRLGPDPWEVGNVAATPAGAAVATWTWMAPRRGSGTNLRPRVVLVSRRGSAGATFTTGRRISPLPAAPPYGNSRGITLSATRPTVARRGQKVVVAWQRLHRIEARVSQDGGRTFGPVRTLGASEESFPGLAAGVARNGRIVVAWSARVAAGGTLRRLVTRVAQGPADGPLRTTTIARTAPVEVPFAVADQFGPAVRLAFPAAGPVLGWQDIDAGTLVVRTRALDDAGSTATAAPADGTAAALEDLIVGADGRSTVAWRTVTDAGNPLSAYTRTGADAPVKLAAGAPVTRVRLAATPIGLLAVASVQRDGGAAALAFREAPSSAP